MYYFVRFTQSNNKNRDWNLNKENIDVHVVISTHMSSSVVTVVSQYYLVLLPSCLLAPPLLLLLLLVLPVFGVWHGWDWVGPLRGPGPTNTRD